MCAQANIWGEQKGPARVMLVSLISSSIGATRIELLSNLTTKKKRVKMFSGNSSQPQRRHDRKHEGACLKVLEGSSGV